MAVFPFAADAAHNDPSVDLDAAPISINRGERAVLVWSSANADVCSASGGWSGSKSTSGSEITSPLSHTTYSVICTKDGKTASDSITIQVNSNQPPVTGTFNAACAVSNPTVTVGNTVNFVAGQAGGIAPLTFVWSGDVSGVGQTRSVSFSTTGTKFATVAVTDGQGRTKSANCSVHVVPVSVAQTPPPPPPVAAATAATPAQTTCDCNDAGTEVKINENGNIIEVAKTNDSKSFLASIFTADNGGPSMLLYLLLFFLIILVIAAVVRYHMYLDRATRRFETLSMYPPQPYYKGDAGEYQNRGHEQQPKQYDEPIGEPIDESIFEPKRNTDNNPDESR